MHAPPGADVMVGSVRGAPGFWCCRDLSTVLQDESQSSAALSRNVSNADMRMPSLRQQPKQLRKLLRADPQANLHARRLHRPCRGRQHRHEPRSVLPAGATLQRPACLRVPIRPERVGMLCCAATSFSGRLEVAKIGTAGTACKRLLAPGGSLNACPATVEMCALISFRNGMEWGGLLRCLLALWHCLVKHCLRVPSAMLNFDATKMKTSARRSGAL
jgi:hypothetical protein